MKEWICEEVPAVTVDGKVVSTMLHQKQELIRCKDCKFSSPDWEEAVWCELYDCRRYVKWYCADGEHKA